MGQTTSQSASSSITVVNPRPTSRDAGHHDDKLTKLTELKHFLPILPSSTRGSDIPPTEILNVLELKDVLRMVSIYGSHLHQRSNRVATEQRILTSRLKDIDLFAAGVSHNLSTRLERTEKMAQQVAAVEELAQQVQQATESLERCMELANQFNSGLPERERLEHFRIRTTSEIERETPER